MIKTSIELQDLKKKIYIKLKLKSNGDFVDYMYMYVR
ncbi:hypothetical protein OTSUT76_3060 [Orientia tsutsugamushi str. UT76]|nr:hypothetical protein OTSUT76_3060 [Orientia tsutsugamushi str. UT76]